MFLLPHFPMTKIRFILFNLFFLAIVLSAAAQVPHKSKDFHAGIHSGDWTAKREQILEAESKDPHRNCRGVYCNRCSKHLADYGHEYQYVGGPSQRQRWYRGTAHTIAPVTQRGYDEHGFPYIRRGQPAAVMSKEYLRVLNHAIAEQIQARNAVAAEEVAEDRFVLLEQLHDAAMSQANESREIWELFQAEGCCLSITNHANTGNNAAFPCYPANTQFDWTDTGALSLLGANGRCDYCLAKTKYLKDQAYLAQVAKEMTDAKQQLQKKTAIADEAVRIALLSKDDADKATRFKRVMHKPAK